MTELGEAFVPIRATLDKLDKDLDAAKGKIEGAIGGIGGALGKVGTLALGGIVAAAGAAATAVAGIGAFAFKAGAELDSAFDTILTKTGATGDELAGLEDVFRDVFGSIPTQAEPAADAIATLNQRLGLTGDELGDVAKPLLEMTRLLGGDAATNTELFTRVMGDWGVASEDAASVLDRLFVAQQQTGIGVEDLMMKVVQFGSPLRLMGFSLEDSIAIFGKWEAEGVNAELVMGSLRIAAGKFAKSGEPLRESLLATFESIRSNTDASAALAEGMEVFGARAGPDMVAAIREGRFAFDDLMVALEGADGTIMATASATADWGEKLAVLKNQAMLALEPLGEVLFNVAGTVIDKLTPAFEAAVPIVTSIAEVLGSLIERVMGGKDPLDALRLAIVELMVSLGVSPEVMASVNATVNELIAGFQGLVAGVQSVIEVVKPVVEAAIQWISENVKLQDVLIALGVAIAAVIIPAIASVVAAAAPVIAVFVAVIAVAALLRQAWEENWGGIQEKTAAVWAVVQPLLQQVWDWLKVHVPEAIQWLVERWKERWAQIQEVIAVVWPVILTIFTAIKDFVLNTLIPTIQDLYQKWTEVWWPTIQTVLENVWTIIEEVFKEVGRWVNDNIIPWVEELQRIWAEEVWPAIQKGLEDAWAVIEPIWEAFQEWMETNIPEALAVLQPLFEGAMTAIQTAIQPVKDLWDAFTDAVSGFWDWITSHVFSFSISLPDLPDWAIPGSPLPIHSAWKAFAEDLSRMTIMPNLELGGMIPVPLLAEDGGRGSTELNSTTNVYTSADPMRVLRASRHLDKLGSMA